MDNFVVVATYSDQVEASLAQATLAAAGIESFLKFADIGGMLPVLQQAEGVKVLVDEINVDEAKTILSSRAEEQADQ